MADRRADFLGARCFSGVPTPRGSTPHTLPVVFLSQAGWLCVCRRLFRPGWRSEAVDGGDVPVTVVVLFPPLFLLVSGLWAAQAMAAVRTLSTLLLVLYRHQRLVGRGFAHCSVFGVSDLFASLRCTLASRTFPWGDYLGLAYLMNRW